jgi:hypothetical protein
MKIMCTFFVATVLSTQFALIADADDQTPVEQVVVTASHDTEWGSYRRAYQANAFFERFTRTRPLIQAQMQVRPIAPETSVEGLHLHIVGAATNIDVPVDSIGRADVPQLKQAYDEDAVIRLNREPGIYYFSGRYSIKAREDGIYSAADLRTACEQLISAQRESGYRMRLFFKKCVGIKFVYPLADNTASVDFVSGEDKASSIQAVDGHPFEDNSMGLYKIVTYRFSDWPEQGKLVPKTAPIAIGTLYE